MTISELIQQEACKQRIYTEKGKGWDCYDTRMLYEINDEREEAFEAGAILIIEHIIGFAEWINIECVRSGQHQWVYRADNYLGNRTTQELFNLYLQTLQPK